ARGEEKVSAGMWARRSGRGRLPRALAASLAVVGLAIAVSGGSAGAAANSPNVVLILTDDQITSEFDSPVMPQTAALIRNRGVSFSRFYASYPLCCPSRATFLSGQYMHNHMVRGNLPPFGGQQVFASSGIEANSLPVWLQAAGYETAHVGKYLNGYGGGGNPQVPPGWSEWYGQISDYDPAEVGGRLYYNYSLLEKGLVGPAILHNYGSAPGDYQGDVLRDKALGVLGDLSAAGKPFYLEFAPHAPHYPFTPPPRYAGTATATPVPKLPGVNEKNIKDKPLFLRLAARHRLSVATLGKLILDRRMRLEQLHAVDDYVAAIVNRLASLGELSNTYLVFASDNGYFFGEHRIVAGKYLPYEPSAKVPFAIAGPGIPAGATSRELSSNADFAPTVAAIAGAAPTLRMDGRSLLPFAANPNLRSGRPVLLEADVGPGTGTVRSGPLPETTVRRLGLAGRAGTSDFEQEPGAEPQRRFGADGDNAPAYKAIRTNRWLFVVYATGERELYDMAKDPAQLNNLRARKYRKVRRILLGRLIALGGCSGPSCNLAYARDPKVKKKRGKAKRHRPASHA
ncbi:MAG: sulfatase, partial [Solirubrobacterales bacterium]